MTDDLDAIADNSTPVFTQAEVYWIGGYLLGLWEKFGLPDDAVESTDQAIIEVLNAETLE